MSPILVDSCVWITAAKKEKDRERDNIYVKLALEALLDEYAAYWCGPVKLEVLGAVRRDFRKRISLFFQVIPYLRSDESVWEDAKNLSWTLRDNGVHVPWNDILIAAIAKKHNAWIYTIDKHYELMRTYISINLYRPGYGGAFNADYV